MFKFVVSYWICLNILEIALLYCTVLGNLETKRIYSLVPSVGFLCSSYQVYERKLNVGLRPSLLLEGIYNPVCIVPQRKSGKTILYIQAKLDIRFGIRRFNQSFNDIDDSEFVLWICGWT